MLSLLSVALAVGTLRVGMIPDVNPTKLARDSEPLARYLEAKIGQKIALTVPLNYAAVVEALIAGQLDFAYLGGFTYAQARQRAGVVPLVQRTIDQKFHSLFITQANSPIKRLEDLRGKTFAFGDVNSTSGHLMPAYFLHQQGLVPGTALKVTYSGGHPATALAVANGKVDAGAIDETVYNRLIADGTLKKDQIRVFWTTPPFADYVWVARKDLDPKVQAKLRDAYLALAPAKPADKHILDLLRADKYIKASDQEYFQLKQAGLKEGLLKP